ncbi:MAG: ATP-binding protein [Bacteroidales bacterium]
MKEGLCFDKKSLKTVVGKTSDFNELAKDCVAFANAKGGELFIGVEDHDSLPPANQSIPSDLPERIVRRINELTVGVGIQANIVKAENGGEYVLLTVFRSASSVASTTKGGYFMRDSDQSRALMPDELIRLLDDKTAYCWETKVTLSVDWKNSDEHKLAKFVEDVKNSDRVSAFVKEKTTYELLEYYLMVHDNGMLTNLGVLWVGKREHRARLLYAPSVQYIKYDSEDNKINKLVWNDYSLNPKELIEAIWNQVPEWKESYEISDGLWRKTIPAFDEKVVREVLCNAIVHRPYTTRGDIFINMYPDKMTTKNPGRLPLGITVSNLLQKTSPRNEHLSKVFYDLHLMEKEGSGWDLIYQTLLSSGRNIPLPFEGDDYFEVLVERKIMSKEIVRLFEYIDDQYRISDSAKIALGIIMRAKIITSSDLTTALQLPADERLRKYVSSLLDEGIISSRGRGKGTKYFVNPTLISNAKANIQTTLKTIEPHRLKALIAEDLRYHPNSLVSDIHKRLPDVEYNYLQSTVRTMATEGILIPDGGRKFRRYRLP